MRGNGGGGIYEDMLSLAGTLMRGQKDYGATKIGALAEATRDFAAAMPEMPTLRIYVDSAANQLDDLSDYVVNNDFEAMIADAGKLAKRHPMATLSLAIAAGIGASQFMHMPSFGASEPRASAGRGRSRRGRRGR